MNRSIPIDRRFAVVQAGHGLDTRDVQRRLQHYGPNDIIEVAGGGWRDLVRDTASDPMLWFFALTGVLYALVGQRTEAVTLLAAIVPLLVMDVVLHRRTQASTAGLASRLAATATVIRDGAECVVPATAIVPGDVVVVAAGTLFPADGVVVADGALQADESSLTGESFPVAKQALTVLSDDEEPVVAHAHWCFAGTRLLTGRARIVVIFTGRETVYGEIVRSARSSGRAHTPLQGAIQRLVVALLAAALALCGILVVARLQQGRGWLDAFVSAVTLATAAIPEEFPVVFAFYLGVGVYRLAKRKALVRRAVTVENIGRVTCICSDKTGTITEGLLKLTLIEPATDRSVDDLLALAVLVSRRDTGDPLDEAVHERAALDRITPPPVTEVARFPFTEDRKRETCTVQMPDGRLQLVMKGAAEVVIRMVAMNTSDRASWTARVDEMALAGHKVLACAIATAGDRATEEPLGGFELAGLLGFEDPVRDGVAAAVATCRESGIRTIMVTGDHPFTARAVAVRIGLGDGNPTVMVGEELRAAIASGDAGRLAMVDVVARATPSEKLALVQSLQAAGHIVAVTGDGVNDVPALQAADIGIAMGERGTRSAREAASIVLLEDNFRTIVDAIAEGRQLFRNLQLSFKYVMMTHVPLVTTAALLPLVGYPLLYLPVHIIWLEMLIHPTALLVFQELPATGLQPIDRTTRPRFFSRREWTAITVVGVLLTALVTGGYLRSYATADVAHGRAMAMAVLTLGSATITIALSGLRTGMARGVVAATVGLGLLLTQAPPIASRLSLAPLHADDWALAVAANLLVGAAVLVGELSAAPARRASQ